MSVTGAGPRRTGLVLGGGGVLGAAWTIGALRALEEATGFDPRTAEYLLGTSAGSVLVAMLGAGLDTKLLVDNQLGIITEGAPEIDYDPDTGSGGGKPRLPRPGIGSRRLLLTSWLHPRQVHPLVALYSIVPEGRGELEPVGRLVDSVNPGRWSPHPNCWIVAVDYDSGRRTVFGRPGAPEVPLREAVMASCAVPGWYHPVSIDGRRYVDGGVRSSTSAGLLARTGLDQVYVLAPMAAYEYDQPRSVGTALERAARRLVTRGLNAEVAKLRRSGISVDVLAPSVRDLQAIGLNMMDPARRVAVLETALETTAERLAAGPLSEETG